MSQVHRLLCIIASQRAGTTSLQQALGSSDSFMEFGEVFHSDTSLWPGSFFAFTRERNLRPEDMATGEQAWDVALDYIDHLTELAGQKKPMLDVKFNSWHALRSAWGYPHQKPLFMEALQKRRALFLLIRRRNVAEQVVSEQIARATGKWHALSDADVMEPIQLDVKAAVLQAKLIVKAETFFVGHLNAQAPYLSIDYEDLYPDGQINPQLLREIEMHLKIGLPLTLIPQTPRNTPDKRIVSTNYGEVADAVKAAIAGMKRLEPDGRIV